MPTANNGLKSRTRQRAAAHVKATMPAICAECGEPIDLTLDAQRDPMGYTVDEHLPRSLGGDPIDPANLRPMHRRCNSAKGATNPNPVTPHSRDW